MTSNNDIALDLAEHAPSKRVEEALKIMDTEDYFEEFGLIPEEAFIKFGGK